MDSAPQDPDIFDEEEDAYEESEFSSEDEDKHYSERSDSCDEDEDEQYFSAYEDQPVVKRSPDQPIQETPRILS